MAAVVEIRANEIERGVAADGEAAGFEQARGDGDFAAGERGVLLDEVEHGQDVVGAGGR